MVPEVRQQAADWFTVEDAMSFVHAHDLFIDDDERKGFLAHIQPASEADAIQVLNADPHSMDGRSNWVWVRLQNGDLILGVFPQGDTYSLMEDADRRTE